MPLNCPHEAQKRGLCVYQLSFLLVKDCPQERALPPRFAQVLTQLRLLCGDPPKARQEALRAETSSAVRQDALDRTCPQQVAAVRAEQKCAKATRDGRKDVRVLLSCFQEPGCVCVCVCVYVCACVCTEQGWRCQGCLMSTLNKCQPLVCRLQSRSDHSWEQLRPSRPASSQTRESAEPSWLGRPCPAQFGMPPLYACSSH